MMRVLRIFFFLYLVCAAVCFNSCSSGNEESAGESAPAEPLKGATQNLSKAQRLFYTLPSPFELASMLKQSGAQYNKDILSSTENLSRFNTSKSKAFNFGVYGADLSYSSIYGQTQSSMIYVSCLKKLADELGLSSAFDQQTIQRIEANKANEDSVRQIVSESYLFANSYLKENERMTIASLILAGGWIEGTYISAKLIDPSSPNEALLTLVAEQKYSLENLIALLESENNGDVEDILADLKGLKLHFDKLEESHEAETKLMTDKQKRVSVIGGEASLSTISKNQIALISQETEKIRNKYVVQLQ